MASRLSVVFPGRNWFCSRPAASRDRSSSWGLTGGNAFVSCIAPAPSPPGRLYSFDFYARPTSLHCNLLEVAHTDAAVEPFNEQNIYASAESFSKLKIKRRSILFATQLVLQPSSLYTSYLTEVFPNRYVYTYTANPSDKQTPCNYVMPHYYRTSKCTCCSPYRSFSSP